MTWCWVVLMVTLLLTGRWGKQKRPVPPSSPSSPRRNRCSSTKDLTLSNPYSGKLQQKVSRGNGTKFKVKMIMDFVFDSEENQNTIFFHLTKKSTKALDISLWLILDCFVRSLTFNVSRLVISIIQMWLKKSLSMNIHQWSKLPIIDRC